MRIFIVILCFYTTLASAQEESPFEIKDNLFKVDLFHNISLSDKFTLQNGLSIRKSLAFDTFEIPVLIRYKHSNKWSSYFGVHARKAIYSYFPEHSNLEEPSTFYLSIGTEYEFKNNTVGNFSIGFPFDVNLGLKF